jgi:hypothetical protein
MTFMNESNMEDTLETIAAMLHQEHAYNKIDWTRLGQQQHQEHTPSSSSRSSSAAPLHHFPETVDIECRSKMATWCIQIVDFCKFTRETAEISMSHLDRFLATPAGAAALHDRTLYQLASMAALYTAVKIHEPEAMDPKLVSNLSRGAYSAADVEAMERQLLSALSWRVNPPTCLSFVRKLMELIPVEAMDQEMLRTAFELTKFQTELAVHDFQFVTVKPSVVAYCSLMNSLESLGLDDNVLGYLGLILSQALQISTNGSHVVLVQNALYCAVLQQPVDPSFVARDCTKAAFSASPASKQAGRRLSIEVSPRSISTTR